MIHLDTNIVIAYFNGNKIITEKIKSNIDKISVSAIVVSELDYGAKASQNAKKNLEKMYQFIDLIQVIDFDLECAKICGTIKNQLRSIGKPTGESDAMIASVAIAHHATIITANKKHFENIEGLRMQEWL
jgi:tRNA(fMet)-specific endonuclease VapC